MLPLLFIVAIAFLMMCCISRDARPRRFKDSSQRPEPPKPPLRSLSDDATNIKVSSVGSHAGGCSVYQLKVPVRREVFTPPLPNGTHYKLIFTGRCAVRFYATWYCFDVCYKTDDAYCNYTKRHHALCLDSKAVSDSPLEEDRAEHRYVFPYRANGSRLSVLLESPIGSFRKAAEVTSDINLTVVRMTRSEISMFGLDEEERRREQKREQHEKQALHLATQAHLEVNFLDPEYRQRFAQKHNTKILNGLRAEWLEEYRRVLGDEQLYALILEQHPHVMPYLEARLEVVRVAERLSQQEEKTAEMDKALAQQQAERADRIAGLVLAYREFEHYESDDWIMKYATNRQHQKELLAERSEILAADKAFHRDRDFIAALKASAPGTYKRATWQTRALALAEKLSATPPRLSKEEKEAKIHRFRQNMLDKLNVRAQDEIAKKLQRFESVRMLREQAEVLGLDEDQIDRLEQELLGDLFQDDDDQSSGYKQL